MPPGIIVRPRRRRGRPSTRRRGVSLSRKVGLSADTVYKFTRYSVPLSLVQSTTGVQTIPFVQTFALDQVQGHADFVTLFDQYKIVKVDYYMQLLTNPDTFANQATGMTNANNASWYPTIWYIQDYDDQVVSTLALIKEKQGVKRKVLKPNQMIKFTIYPKFQKATYQLAPVPPVVVGTMGYGPATGWLDCNDNIVPHFGFKGCVDFHGVTTNTQYNIEVTAKYHLEFKGAQ